MRPSGRLPGWLRRRLPAGRAYHHTEQVIDELGLETICNSANCPNRGECWSRGTATVLILGNVCTRNCRFCSVAGGKPAAPDATEPERVAEMARRMNLKYLVITSVTRDDLPDGGAEQFAGVVTRCREAMPGLQFELLVPDFRGCQDRALATLEEVRPFVFDHNVETVPSLYPKARPGADYRRSLHLLALAKRAWSDTPTKSALMLGLGETADEVEQVLADLRSVGCDRIAIGQYLCPGEGSLPVVEYVEPDKFDFWKNKARRMGFKWVMASPFTRSSYLAETDAGG